MPIPLLAAIPGLLSSIGGGVAAGAGAIGGGLASGAGALGGLASKLGPALGKFGGTKFGGGLMEALGTGVGRNMTSNKDEEEQLALLQQMLQQQGSGSPYATNLTSALQPGGF